MDYRPVRDEEADRRRRWDEYDRELAAYHRNPEIGRGRSRSPGGEDSGRKRRRSASPWDRGRYERPRYADDKDYSHGRDDYGHRRGGYHGYNGRDSRGRAPPNPYELDHPAQLKHFADWFRYTYPEEAAEEDRLDRLDGDALRQAGSEAPKPRDGVRLRWEKYKKEFAVQQVTLMFEHHKKSPWFAEKYDPSEYYVNLRKRVRKQGWKGKAAQFLLELEEGKLDPQIDPVDDVGHLVDETIQKQSVDTATEISKTDVIKNGTHEDDMQFGMDVEEEHDNENKVENASKTAFEAKSSSRNEEISVMPEGNEILIRTLPPDIGRTKLEEACSSTPGFVHIALGDPSPRKHFYRAGWIKFTDGADMERAVQELSDKKVDGFKLHVTHTTRPFNTRARVAPEAASRPERILKDLEQIKQLAASLEEEAASLRRFRPSDIRLAMDAQQQMGFEGKEGSTSSQTDEKATFPEQEGESESDLSELPSEAIERRVEKLVSEMQEHDLAGGIGLEAKKATITLDLYRAYLRSAYNACYYCATITDHVEELQRKCAKHVRKPLSQKAVEEIIVARQSKEAHNVKDGGEDNDTGLAIEPEPDMSKEILSQVKPDEKLREKNLDSRDWKRNDERWLEWLDSKLALLSKKSDLDPREYGGKSYDEELSKACEPAIKQEDESKYRCKQCNKLFKAVGFVEKHIANKHSELVKHLDELSYFNNFALDPHRMQPSLHIPPPPGNGIGPPPQAYGLKGVSWSAISDFGGGHGRGGSYGIHHPAFVGGPSAHVVYGLPPPYDSWGYGMAPVPAYGGGYPLHHDPMTMAPMGGRRLSERLGGFAEHMDGLPVKPMVGLETRRAPPPDAREDPRASGGRKISYHDIDKAAAGDDVNVELSY